MGKVLCRAQGSKKSHKVQGRGPESRAFSRGRLRPETAPLPTLLAWWGGLPTSSRARAALTTELAHPLLRFLSNWSVRAPRDPSRGTSTTLRGGRASIPLWGHPALTGKFLEYNCLPVRLCSQACSAPWAWCGGPGAMSLCN